MYTCENHACISTCKVLKFTCKATFNACTINNCLLTAYICN